MRNAEVLVSAVVVNLAKGGQGEYKVGVASTVFSFVFLLRYLPIDYCLSTCLDLLFVVHILPPVP